MAEGSLVFLPVIGMVGKRYSPDHRPLAAHRGDSTKTDSLTLALSPWPGEPGFVRWWTRPIRKVVGPVSQALILLVQCFPINLTSFCPFSNDVTLVRTGASSFDVAHHGLHTVGKSVSSSTHCHIKVPGEYHFQSKLRSCRADR